VKVLAVPISIQNMDDEAKEAFSKAVGNTLQIENIDECGLLEINFWPKLGDDTIWIEPFCVKRFRRYKKLSKRFIKILELNEELDRPKYTFSYKAIWPLNGSYDESVKCLTYIGIGQGWYVLPEERCIDGHYSILMHKKNSLEDIMKCREYVLSLNYFENIEVGEIINSN